MLSDRISIVHVEMDASRVDAKVDTDRHSHCLHIAIYSPFTNELPQVDIQRVIERASIRSRMELSK